MQALATTPSLMTRRDTRSLSGVGQVVANALGLESPAASNPGYWKRPDGFVTVNAGLLKDGVKDLEAPLRVLVSFDGRDVQSQVRQRIKESVGDPKTLSAGER